MRHAKRLAYLPALDGMRALAVLAVLFYHLNRRWVPGGFLGVEVFFVISGYLITSVLLAEWRQHGRIVLRQFWQGRARRLLSALFVMIFTVLMFAVLLLPDEVAGLRSDAVAAAGYVTNWYLIFHHRSYFQTLGRPSLLQHLWSLAVEEQYYIVWPVVLAIGLRFLRPRYMLATVLAGATASALLMPFLHHLGVDHSRIYYGTDTRAAGLLVGSALAFVCIPDASNLERRAGRWGIEIAGLAALGVLVWLHLWLVESRSLLYQGGFALVDIATALLIGAAVRPQTRLGQLLALAPLRWIGQRSYSLYLWHWPVFMITRPGVDVPLDGLPLLIFRLGVTLVLAEVSYLFVETPVRRGVLGRAWSGLCEGLRYRRWRLLFQYAGAVGAASGLFVVLGISIFGAQRAASPPYLELGRVQTGIWRDQRWAATAMLTRPVSPTPAPATQPAPSPARSLVTTAHQGIAPTPPQVPVLPLSLPRVSAGAVTAVGDSVMLGAVPELTEAISNISIDAAVGRQVSDGIDVLQSWRDAGQLGEIVIVQLGTNGTFSAAQFDRLMQVLVDVRLVVLINLKVPRDWEAPNNAVLADEVPRYTNAILVDWHSASVNRPELFWGDGFHVRPEGAQLYASLIASSVAAHPAPTPTLVPTSTATSLPSPVPTPTPMDTSKSGPVLTPTSTSSLTPTSNR